MINNILLVATGGAFGSSARYLAGELTSSFIRGQSFPVATILVNIIGCFMAGILHFIFVNYMDSLNTNYRLILMTGFLGGFTTFSAFSVDVFRLFSAGQINMAAAYIILSIILSILAVFFGFYLGNVVTKF